MARYHLKRNHCPDLRSFTNSKKNGLSLCTSSDTEKPYSNLDLAIISDTSLSLSQFAAIEHDFSESDLPFKVDVVDSAAISPAFRGIIENHKARTIIR